MMTLNGNIFPTSWGSTGKNTRSVPCKLMQTSVSASCNTTFICCGSLPVLSSLPSINCLSLSPDANVWMSNTHSTCFNIAPISPFEFSGKTHPDPPPHMDVVIHVGSGACLSNMWLVISWAHFSTSTHPITGTASSLDTLPATDLATATCVGQGSICAHMSGPARYHMPSFPPKAG